jgi:hypothetical protein
MSCALPIASRCPRKSSFISFRASFEKTCMCRLAICGSRIAIKIMTFTGSRSTDPQSMGCLSLRTPIESAMTASVLQ